MKKIKLPLQAILFDLDGTLLDSVSIIMKASKKVLNDMNLEFNADIIRSKIGIPLHVQAIDLAGKRSEEFIERYRVVYREYQGNNHSLFPNTLEMLTELKKIKYVLGVVTSKVAVSAKRSLKALGIYEYFDIVVSADDVDNPKPHPEPLFKALDMLELKSDNVIFVGDSFFDIDCAKFANIVFLGVSWGARSADELKSYGADFVVNNWSEVISIINKIKIEPEEPSLNVIS